MRASVGWLGSSAANPRFIEIPGAERAGVKMALHPDDPPISPLRGIGRILISAAAYRRVLEIVPSPINGVTFCQANFKAMGEDIAAVGREFCQQGKVFAVGYMKGVMEALGIPAE